MQAGDCLREALAPTLASPYLIALPGGRFVMYGFDGIFRGDPVLLDGR